MQFLVELLRNTCPLDRRVGLRLACAIQIPLKGAFGARHRRAIRVHNPHARRFARGLTNFWVAVEVGGRGKIRDAMMGFRIYPLAATVPLEHVGDGMDFDIEVAVELVRRGAPAVNLPVAVRYLTAADGGVSHFHPLRDNLKFAWMHSKLCTAGCIRWTRRALWPFGRPDRGEATP